MIKDAEIERIAEQQSLTPHEVEKDYVHSWILNAMYSRPILARQLVLKGGNALRKAYLPNTRYSKDLDFSCLSHIEPAVLESELKEVCQIVEAQTSVKFLDKTLIKNKDLPFEVDALEARVYFKGFYNEEKVDLKTQVDVTQFDKILLPVQSRQIIHPYSDSSLCNGIIQCHKAEEIFASKLTTLLHRRKCSDIFDLLYGILLSGEFSVSRLEVITTFLRKSIFQANPDTARQQLLAVPLSEYEVNWNGLVAPRTSLFGFEVVTSRFSEMINSLFDNVAQPIRRMVGGFAPSIARNGRNSGIGRPSSQFSFASGHVRSTIIQAGANRKMVELVYGGNRRLVEPYKLEYYIRKSDGVGNEYFWGYDTTGGSSGRTSIKQFFCDQIQSVSIMDRSFTPRYAVEF